MQLGSFPGILIRMNPGTDIELQRITRLWQQQNQLTRTSLVEIFCLIRTDCLAPGDNENSMRALSIAHADTAFKLGAGWKKFVPAYDSSQFMRDFQ